MTQFPSSQPRESNSKLVLIAIVVAVAAFILGNLYVSLVRQQAMPGQTTIYRLNQTVRPGDVFDPDMVDAFNIPSALATSFPDAINIPAQMYNREGQTIRRRGNHLEVFTTRLFDDSDRDRPDQGITREFVDKAIQVNPRRLPGYMRTDMVVNILAPFDTGNKIEILPVLEKVRIRSVGAVTADIEEEQGFGRVRIPNYNTITVTLRPDQARDIEQISRIIVGEFDIQVRNPSDESNHFSETAGGRINPRVLTLVEETQTPARRTGVGAGGGAGGGRGFFNPAN